ncbi:hypothetical protein B0H19DRAFT_198215 [Mycena capillaripes]|nr:hypothetical protein B0H19DRAFT_198215 [Mycena capillaripes]
MLINHVVAGLQPPADNISATTDSAAAIKSIVRQAIDVFDTKTFQSLAPQKTQRSTDDIVDMFKFCSEVGARSEWQYLLGRLESTPPGIFAGLYVSEVLTPSMHTLRGYLRSQNLDLVTEPFQSFTAKVLKAFGTSVMSLEPKELVANADIGCTCKDCDDLRNFLGSDKKLSISFNRSTGARQHLIRYLQSPKLLWGVTFEVVKRKSSQVLEITEPENMTAAGLAAENEVCGRALLAMLGNEAAQKRILGSDYREVVALISRKGAGGEKRTAVDNQEKSRAKKRRT